MSENHRDAIWKVGIRLLHMAKRIGLSGPVEHIAWGVAPHIIPPPARERSVLLPSGMRLVIPAGFPRARTYLAGVYEEEVTMLVNSTLKEGLVFVDVGAFVGYYTLIASRLVGESGKVYAFEADPRNYAFLEMNLESNSCHNVTPVNEAVSEGTGTLALVLHKEVDRHWPEATFDSETSTTVPAITLDDFFANEGWPPVDLIKMDIEGGERHALEGMRELSERNPHLGLIMEFDPANLRRVGATREILATILQELGFGKGKIIEQNMRSFALPHGLPKRPGTYNLFLQKDQ